MHRTHVAVGLSALLTCAATALAPPASAAQGTLAGTWTSVDTDGSTQTLTVTGSGNRAYSLFYTDDVASGACGGAPAQVVGPGSFDGETLSSTGTLTCRPGGNVFRFRLELSYTYDAQTDTLSDGFGVLWKRAR